MKSDKTRELVILSLYAALIIVSVQFIRIPFGPQFVHLGNALVVIAVLIFGARKGALVATVGLGLFDIFNGYAAEVWITILESLIVCYVLYLVFESPVIDWIAVDIQHIAFPFVDDRHRKPGFEAEARVIVPVGQYRAVADSRLAGRKLQFPLQVVG